MKFIVKVGPFPDAPDADRTSGKRIADRAGHTLRDFKPSNAEPALLFGRHANTDAEVLTDAIPLPPGAPH
jgi:hypothetical protein